MHRLCRLRLVLLTLALLLPALPPPSVYGQSDAMPDDLPPGQPAHHQQLTGQELDTLIHDRITAQVVNKELLLRSLTSKDQLDYDPSGYAYSGLQPGPLTMSGVRITRVQVASGKITLTGNRVALEYRAQTPEFRRIDLPDRPILITLHRDGPGDRELYASAIGRIFGTSREPDFDQQLPEWWHGYFSADYRQEVMGGYADMSADIKLHHMDNDSLQITHPKLIAGNTSILLTPKDKLFAAGTVRLRLVVNDEGVPTHIFVDQPLGYGMEELAVRQARKLRFRPATLNGNPTDGEIFVNISFVRQRPPAEPRSQAPVL